MSWLSDRWRDVKRGLSSDAGKLAIGAGLGAYWLKPAMMSGFLKSSMLKNMARRYATSYLTNTALGRPHAHKGAMSSALWSLPFQAFKNYQLTQPLGKVGMEGYREGTDTPWWKLMLGQGRDAPVSAGFETVTDPAKMMVNPKGPSDVFLDAAYRKGPWEDSVFTGGDPFRSVSDYIPQLTHQVAKADLPMDPELGFLDMFMKDKPTYGDAEGGGKLADLLGLSSKGPITGYEKGIHPLAFAPEVMGYAASDWTDREKEEQAAEKAKRQQALFNEMMINPYYDDSNMYRFPGWGLTAGANRGGIMQALQGGGDFLEDLVSQEDPAMNPMGTAPEITPEDYGPVGMPEEAMMAEEGIPDEILEGIVNQRDPLMEKIMEMIMRMIAPTLGEDEEMPMMGPTGMGEMGDYLGPRSEMGVEEQGDLGMFGGGTATPQVPGGSMGAFKDWWLNREGPAGKFSPQSVSPMSESNEEELPPWMWYLLDKEMATGGDYTRGAHVSGPGTGTSDSINAKLSDGEFVMTANAVKNLGGGDRYAGARKMYNMMNSLDPNSARPGEEPQVV